MLSGLNVFRLWQPLSVAYETTTVIWLDRDRIQVVTRSTADVEPADLRMAIPAQLSKPCRQLFVHCSELCAWRSLLNVPPLRKSRRTARILRC